MVSEWPRWGNDLNSVVAEDFPYSFSADFTMAGGTVWSDSPEMSSNGPRVAFAVSTFDSALGLRVAAATWKSGNPGAGIVVRSYSSDASFSETAFANP